MFPADLAAHLTEDFRRRGVDVRFRHKVMYLARTPGNRILATLSGDQRLEVDKVVVAIGSLPQIELGPSCGRRPPVWCASAAASASRFGLHATPAAATRARAVGGALTKGSTFRFQETDGRSAQVASPSVPIPRQSVPRWRAAFSGTNVSFCGESTRGDQAPGVRWLGRNTKQGKPPTAPTPIEARNGYGRRAP